MVGLSSINMMVMGPVDVSECSEFVSFDFALGYSMYCTVSFYDCVLVYIMYIVLV